MYFSMRSRSSLACLIRGQQVQSRSRQDARTTISVALIIVTVSATSLLIAGSLSRQFVWPEEEKWGGVPWWAWVAEGDNLRPRSSLDHGAALHEKALSCAGGEG